MKINNPTIDKSKENVQLCFTLSNVKQVISAKHFKKRIVKKACLQSKSHTEFMRCMSCGNERNKRTQGGTMNI